MRISEFINEAVGGNYLYHGTDVDSAKKILSTGYLLASQSGKQTASSSQTPLPVVSFSRSWQYELNPKQEGRGPYTVVFVIDRRALETRNKTFATSQSQDIGGLGYHDDQFQNVNPKVRDKIKRRVKFNRGIVDVNKDGIISPEEAKAAHELYTRYWASKAGGEFEEIVPAKDGKLFLKGILVGFWINPKTDAAGDETLMNHPMRLDPTGPNTFKRANTAGVRDNTETVPTKSRDFAQRRSDKKQGQERARQMSKIKS